MCLCFVSNLVQTPSTYDPTDVFRHRFLPMMIFPHVIIHIDVVVIVGYTRLEHQVSEKNKLGIQAY